MPPRPPQRDRLSRLMNARRLELGLTWEQVAKDGGASYEAMRAARNDDAEIRGLTLSAIDRGLRWEAGSATRILNEDGDPVALPSRPRITATPLSVVPAPAAPIDLATASDAVIEAFISAWPVRTEEDKRWQGQLRRTWDLYRVAHGDRETVVDALMAVLHRGAPEPEPREERGEGRVTS